MQLSITKKRMTVFALMTLLSVGGVVIWKGVGDTKNDSVILFSSKLSKLENQNPLMRSIAGKSMTAFRADYTFYWADKAQGVGRVRVELQSRSFVAQSWSYQWVVPDGAFTQGETAAAFDSPRFRETHVFELEIAGLDSTLSQNIFLKLKPATRDDAAMTVVIPTQSEQTAEGALRRSSIKSAKIQSLRKSLAGPTEKEFVNGHRADKAHSAHRLQF